MDTEAPGAVDDKRSKFIVYVDESGDHSLQKIDPEYPVFVLSFCIFNQRYYADTVVPAIEKFKFDKFGHDIVILHEREIRKELGVFRFPDRAYREKFIDDLTTIIDDSNFILVSCVIDKNKLGISGDIPENPYHIALGFCVETLLEFLTEKGQEDALTHIVFEKRGDKEDKELELEFRRLCAGANRLGTKFPFEIIFAAKGVNSAGLQLADLVARPIGVSYLRPDQNNRAFDVLKRKFFCSGGRQALGVGYENWGLKIYPQESEKPR